MILFIMFTFYLIICLYACTILSAMAANRMVQDKPITMTLITLNANGCLAFLDFLLLTIIECDKKELAMHYTTLYRPA